MEGLTRRIMDVGRSAALLGGWVVIASALSIVLNASGVFDGDGPAMIRVALGLFGLAAGALFWSGRDFGKPGLQAILAWGVLQVPVYAWQPDGNPTKQLFDLVLGMSSRTVVNGEVTNFSQVGVNLVGVAVVIWAVSCRDRLDLWRRRSLSPAA